MKKLQKKNQVRIALSGDRGKMGKSLQNLIKKSPSMKLTNRANTEISPETWSETEIDAVIDFSLPPLFTKTLLWCVKNKKVFVSGTTGLSSSQKQALKRASKKIPVFYGENMSGEIFLISQWLKSFFNEDVQVFIEDIHRKNKKDKPSGTALRLKKNLPAFLRKKVQIKSIRKGDVFGTHRIIFKNSEEILTIEHQALNRNLFAKGALQALIFVLKKEKGYYTPQDLYFQKKLSALP